MILSSSAASPPAWVNTSGLEYLLLEKQNHENILRGIDSILNVWIYIHHIT